jgi:hypothetical protein
MLFTISAGAFSSNSLTTNWDHGKVKTLPVAVEAENEPKLLTEKCARTEQLLLPRRSNKEHMNVSGQSDAIPKTLATLIGEEQRIGAGLVIG